ncbi:MAG: hypothetical protein N2422_08355 [Rhodobacteraceae bacterium]|nr:hypothetical protein [Paracoccaceae bacterium]
MRETSSRGGAGLGKVVVRAKVEAGDPVVLVAEGGQHQLPKTGILVTGSFILDQTKALTLPASAITLKDGFSYVFVVQPGDTATVLRERVETGRRRGDRVEILSGLARDAQVVLAGGAFLSDGSVVRVVEGRQ